MHIRIIILSLCLLGCYGFLVEDRTTKPTTVVGALSEKHFYMLLNLLTEERQARLNLEGRFLQLQKEQLATETGVTSIHHSSYVNNKTLEDQAHLLKTLEARFSDLKNDHDALKVKFKQLQLNHSLLQKSSNQLENEFTSLKQLPLVGELQFITEVRNETKHLANELTLTKSKLGAVTNDVNARKQDFIALFQKADQTENNLLNTNTVLGILESKINISITQIEERFIQFKNRTHEDLANKLKAEEVMQNKSLSNAYSMVETQIYNLENTINFTLSRLDFISSPVAMTACVGAGRNYAAGDVVSFTEILSVNGLSNSELSTFKSGGIFRCTRPGTYFLSTHLTTSTDDGVAALYMDKKTLSQFYFSLNGHWQTNGVVVLQNLLVNDLVFVKIDRAMQVLGGHESCLSLFQVL